MRKFSTARKLARLRTPIKTNMANPKEDTLEVKMEKSAARLKAACGVVVGQQEPLHILQGMKWESLMLRAEVTALRDMMRVKGVLDTAEYQRRAKDVMDEYTSLIERSVGIQVMDDARVIVITDRADKNRLGGLTKGKPS